MKKKNRLQNGIMIAVILAVLAAGILAVGAHQGWFDRKDAAETALVTSVAGTADLTRDGIVSPLSGETALRDGDGLSTQNPAGIVLQTGDSTLTQGAGTAITVTHAAADAFSAEVTSGQVFVSAGETPVTLTFGGQTCTLSSAVADLTVRTGSETLYLLVGTLTLEGTEYSAGQALSWVGGSLTADAFTPSVLDDEALSWCLAAKTPLCFTQEELQKVIDDRTAQQQAEIEAQVNPDSSADASAAASSDPSADSTAAAGETGETPTADTGRDSTSTDSGSANTAAETTDTEPAPDPEPEPEPEKKASCTISIRCDTILANMDNLDPDKSGYVPSSGTILSTTTVTISEGDSVYDVLKRACSAAGIQMEASYTAAYGSYYVEGIGHLYEFDCGPESGWMYKVNGWFPNYGCSSYSVSDGDTIVFCYTCNGLGADVGA